MKDHKTEKILAALGGSREIGEKLLAEAAFGQERESRSPRRVLVLRQMTEVASLIDSAMKLIGAGAASK